MSEKTRATRGRIVPVVQAVQPLRSVQDVMQSKTDEPQRETIDVEAIAVGSLAIGREN